MLHFAQFNEVEGFKPRWGFETQPGALLQRFFWGRKVIDDTWCDIRLLGEVCVEQINPNCGINPFVLV